MEEEDMYDVIPCSSQAVESLIRTGTAGAIWGMCVGPYEANQQGLRGIAKASYVARSVGRFAIRCGVVAGVYNFTRCGLRSYRGKNDWVNGSIAGAIAGAAIAAGTRSRAKVIGIAGLASAYCATIDYSRPI